MNVFECFDETVDHFKKSCFCLDTNLNHLSSWQKLSNATPGEKRKKNTHILWNCLWSQNRYFPTFS